MKGYKVFNLNWTYRDFKFETGKNNEEDVTPKCCDRGFHFCTKAAGCFKYYSIDPDNKEIVKTLPNFDKDIFKEITTIDVER